MPFDYKQTLNLHESLHARRLNFLNEYQDVVDYILPHAGNATRLESPGQRRGRRRYSSTAVQATKDFSSLMAATVTNAAQRWFLWELRNPDLRKSKPIRDWFDEANKRGREALNDSNFYQLIQVAYKDFGGFGTVTMWLHERKPRLDGSFGGVFFSLPSIREYAIQEGPEGMVDTITRKWKMDVNVAIRRFENENGFRSIHPNWAEKARSTDGAKGISEVEILQIVHPEGDVLWSSYYDCENQHLIARAPYREQPFATARFDMTSEDQGWGRGAGMEILCDVLGLNEAKRLEERGWAKDIDPPLMVESESVIGRVSGDAGKLIWRKRGTEAPQYLHSATRFDSSKFKTDEKEAAIYAAYYLSDVRMLTAQRPGNMSETEFLQRTQDAMQRIGPMYFRLTHEFLDVLLMRLFGIMFRNGAFPPLPDEMVQLERQGFDLSRQVSYTGPIARAQRMLEHGNTSEFLSFGVQMAQGTGQLDALDWINTDEAMKQAHELLGAPSPILRGAREVEEIRQQRAEQQQQAQMEAAIAQGLGAPGAG